MLVFAFPRWNVEPVVWLWTLPLRAALWLGHPPPAENWWQRLVPFRLGYLAGLCFFLPNLSWVLHSSRVIHGAVGNEWMGWPVELLGWSAALGLSGYAAIYFGLWAWFAAKIARPREILLQQGSAVAVSLDSLRSASLAAAAWTALEWTRGWMLTGFGWNGLSVGLHQNKVLIQAADLIGVYGLSFLPVFCAVIGFNVMLRLVQQVRLRRHTRYHFDLLLAMVLVLSVATYGMHSLSAGDEAEHLPVRVALVQQNVPQADKFAGNNLAERYQRYAELTHQHAAPRDGTKHSPVDLVVWPESALGLPFYHRDHSAYFDDLLGIGDFSLLTGCDVLEPGGNSYTSAALLHEAFDGAQLYHKVHLVPFGEYLPLRPLLGPILGGVLPGDFVPGPSLEPLLLNKPAMQVIPLICFEDTVGNLARQFVRPQAQLIVNLTNDGWFLQSAEPEQHLANALFRAIELRRPMCRATNTGVTCFIDECGRVTSKLIDPDTGSSATQGVLQSTVQVRKHPPLTLYARWGDWFAMLGAALCLLALIRRKFSRADEISGALP